MAHFSTQRAREFYAETYDTVASDWPEEIAFYRLLAAEARSKGQAVLEVACGTGRVAVRLAGDGVTVVGLDLSEAMLAVARRKSAGMGNIRWVQADMRAFDLGETFGLAIIPGHSLQNILTLEDQVATLESVRRHLVPGGTLVLHIDHLSVEWLGELVGGQGGSYEDAESFTHPVTGARIRVSNVWSYEPASQIAVSRTIWEAVDGNGIVTDRWESGPLQFHCFFRYEAAHLLERTGFEIKALYGDFYKHPLDDDSSEMVWVAVKV